MSKRLKLAFVSAVALVTIAAAGQLADVRASQDSIRFCCTPQQVNQCAATGGTATCRTGVCQCLF